MWSIICHATTTPWKHWLANQWRSSSTTWTLRLLLTQYTTSWRTADASTRELRLNEFDDELIEIFHRRDEVKRWRGEFGYCIGRRRRWQHQHRWVMMSYSTFDRQQQISYLKRREDKWWETGGKTRSEIARRWCCFPCLAIIGTWDKYEHSLNKGDNSVFAKSEIFADNFNFQLNRKQTVTVTVV